jgi:pimeloyl-ACP methyl ester carboxylesterase
VLALDYRSHGRSEYDRNPDNYTLPVALADLSAVLTALEIAPAIFVGTSYGGLLVMMLAVWRPTAIAVALLRPQPNARSVGQPEPAALGLLMGNLQPFTLPDTLDPLVVDYPARLAQERGDLAVAIAAVVPGELDNIGCETLLVVTTTRDLAVRRAMLPERRTGATLGHMQPRSHLLDTGSGPHARSSCRRWLRLQRPPRSPHHLPLIY